jgi:Sulfotransferase family
MSASDADAPARRRFARVMKPPSGKVFVEKSPTNALRIGFLDGLAAEARFIHIVRDGDDVVRSIARKAARTRRVVGRGMVNDWWGSNDSKWRLMRDEGAAAGYYADEVALLEGDQDRAAYEWLVSVGEVDRWRPSLADRLHEITYRDLTESPHQVVSELAGFLGIASPDRWVEEATSIVKPMRRNDGPSIVLPRGMAEDFNGLQRRYGFEGRVGAAAALQARNAAVSR